MAKEISDQVKVVRENFTANLLSFAGKVARTEKDAYKASVTASQTAGAPIVEHDQAKLALAIEERAKAVKAEAQPSVNGAKPDAEPQPQPVETPA